MLVHPDPGLEHEVLLDREAGDEEILLLDVGGHGGKVGRGDQLAVSDPGAGYGEALGVPEEEGVEEAGLARSARAFLVPDLSISSWLICILHLDLSVCSLPGHLMARESESCNDKWRTFCKQSENNRAHLGDLLSSFHVQPSSSGWLQHGLAAAHNHPRLKSCLKTTPGPRPGRVSAEPDFILRAEARASLLRRQRRQPGRFASKL